MLTIVYSEHGKSNADAKSEFIAMNMYEKYKDKNYRYLSSTESLFTAFRVMVAEKKINHTDVVFKFENKTLELDEDGQLKDGYPKGFCDVDLDLYSRLIDTKVKNK